MLEQLEAIRERFLEVEQQIAMPEVVSDLKKFKTLSKEYKDLQKIVDQYLAYQQTLQSIDEAKDVIATEKDEDFRDMAKAELEELIPKEKELQEVLKEKEKGLIFYNEKIVDFKKQISELEESIKKYECS